MTNKPDYKRATNAAYDVLKSYIGYLPQINVYEIIASFHNIRLVTYSTAAKKLGCSFSTFVTEIASSAHGFTVFDSDSGKYIIFYNDYKDKKTIRFTLAHELGHIVLGHDSDDAANQKEADCFARNLLCPVPIVDGFHLQTENDYVKCFRISEPMAEVSRQYRLTDRYNISEDNYQMMSDKLFCFMSGMTAYGF